MYSEATVELLAAKAQIEELRAELAAKRAMQKPTMETLKVRFPSSIDSGCEMLADKMDDKWSKSDIARAAIYLGLKQINEVLERDPKKANGLMQVIKLRAALGK